MTLVRIADQLEEQWTFQVTQYLWITLIASQVIDPTNWKPMHMHTSGVLEAGDVRWLKGTVDGYLHIVFR